ncbi:MAG: 16S rRNA (uracil(1498)-N(3))-methyltransferase [Ignavibacteria bacterium]|nr:MAG: 16S rRNA (uracil(1498)-N(3))-methyltransferase [Ignavibacteria bacterium]
MDYFYCPPEKIREHDLVIEGEEFSHLVHVMRKKEGDEIIVVDGRGSAYDVGLETVTRRSARCVIKRVFRGYHEPSASVTMAAGILKNPSKFDFLVEKLTELGVMEIIPLRTERTIPSHARTDRWQKLALSAMKQCGRSYLPAVRDLTTLDSLIGDATRGGRKFIAHERLEAGISLTELRSTPGESTLILVGPEGGFSDEEFSRSLHAGFKPVFLGDRRLRTETATIVLASLLLC